MYTKQNDTYDKIIYSPNVGLTGASAVFKMESRSGTLLVNATAEISGNDLVYQLQPGDTIVNGLHRGEFTVTFTDGKEKTFPEDGYLQINISKDIDTNRDTETVERIAVEVSLIEDAKNDAIAAADSANTQAAYAKTQGDYALTQGTYAKDQGDIAKLRTDELNGVDATQFKDRQDQFDAQLAQNTKHRTDWCNVVESFAVKNDGTLTKTELTNAFNSSYNTFYFPDGTYMADSLPIKSNMRLVLSKNATLKLTDSSNVSLLIGGIVSDFEIEGGKFDGNKANNTVGNAPLISIDDATSIKVNIDHITNTIGHGFYVKKGIHLNIEIDLADDINGNAVRAEDTSNSSIKVKNGENIANHGICIRPVTRDCEFVLVEDSILKNVAQGTYLWGIYFNSGDVYIVKNSKIVNCKVDGSGYGGIFPGGDDNDVVNSDAVNCAGWRGMWIHDAKNINVFGGKFNNNGRDGILVGKAHNVKLISPKCEGNAHHGILLEYDTMTTGRYVGDDTNKNVDVISPRCNNNSQSAGNTYSGVYLKSFKNAKVIGATCTDTQATKTQRRGIESDNLGSGHIIIGNDFTGNVNAGLIHINDGVNIEGNIGIHNHLKYGTSPHPTPLLGHSYFDQGTGKLMVYNGTAYKGVSLA